MVQPTSSRKQRRQWFLLYITFLFLLSEAILFMPFANERKETSPTMLYIAGATFWFGLLGVIVMALVINSARKRSQRFNKLYPGLKQLGVVHFFRNKPAVIADLVMFVSIIGFIIATSLRAKLLLSFLLLAISVFSFGMHCMLNGINYKYINHKAGREIV